MENDLKPSEQCHLRNITLKEFAKRATESEQSLINWYKGKKRRRFMLLLDAVVREKEKEQENVKN